MAANVSILHSHRASQHIVIGAQSLDATIAATVRQIGAQLLREHGLPAFGLLGTAFDPDKRRATASGP